MENNSSITHNPNCNVICEDFVMLIQNFMPEGYCQEAIEKFEFTLDQGFGYNRQERDNVSALKKKDEHCFSLDMMSKDVVGEQVIARLGDVHSKFNDAFRSAMQYYTQAYGVVSEMNLVMPEVKWQKTPKSGGYHVWHCEAADRSSSHRVLSWIYYLNTVEEGGETEFLYQSKRVRPEENALLIFPAAFTHTHRGNPPLSGDKYIATGWIEF